MRRELGDSDMPFAPQSGGSGLAISLAGAVQAAAANVLKALLSVVAEDERSPLRGATAQKIAASNGRIHLADDPSVGETFTDILTRHELAEVTADGEASPKTEGATMAPSPAFAALLWRCISIARWASFASSASSRRSTEGGSSTGSSRIARSSARSSWASG
jgi:xanthine dehydrogenase YagR molybdenum-binding subunit